MIGQVKKFTPQVLINYGKHLPLALLANIRYGFPSRKIKVIGVTGTDGKTTTTNMIYQILRDAGKKVSMVSTINAEIAGQKYDTGFHVTNPDPFDVQKFLKAAVKAGDEFIVLETTSHGLDQFRVWGVKYRVGVVTNITHEHLDYHKTFLNYLQAKAKLVKQSKIVVLNYDDSSFKKLLTYTKKKKLLTFGKHKRADFRPGKFNLKLKISGEYNQYNAMAAMAAASALGISPAVAKKSLENFRGLSGRMEEIKNNKGIKVVVDFAHTPNALEQALIALRGQTKGKVIAVFGCAGARDKGKRSLMGAVSAKLSDITILTDEDPRFEDRDEIIAVIAASAIKAGAVDGKNLFKQPDRGEAIKTAIKMAQKGDTVGIFGKGHEKSMSYRGVEKPWSDQEAAGKALHDG